MNKYKIGLVQMNSSGKLSENLVFAENAVREAIDNQTDLVIFPEIMNRLTGRDEVNNGEELTGPTITRMSKLSRELNVWIHCGSIKEASDLGKPYNTSVLLDNQGNIRAVYRKIHLFDADVGGRLFRESDKNSQGNQIVTVGTPFGKLGFAVCYDLRFPELFRIMALRGAEAVILPANFTYKTGEQHWQALIRARAIENGIYIFAVNQTGVNKLMHAYGHSMVADPWGQILVSAGVNTGVYYAEIDRSVVVNTQRKMPSLKNRRSDVYDLKYLVNKIDN